MTPSPETRVFGTNDSTANRILNLNSPREETLDLGSDDQAQLNQRNRSGIRIRVTTDVAGLKCRLSAMTDGVTTAHLTDDSGTVLEQQAIGGLESGQTFSFDTELSANETYLVLCDADGQSYTRGRAAVDYPIEGDSLIATHGVYTGNGTRSNSYRYCIDRITPVGTRSEIGGTLDLGDDDLAQPGQRNRSGIRIETTETIDGLACRISRETVGIITAYLVTDAGTVLERQTTATLAPGERFAFESELEADTAYWILCDASGRTYTRGRAAVDYPIEGESLVATRGIYTGNGARSNSYRYCIDQITPGGIRNEIGVSLDLENDDQAQFGQRNRSGVRIQATDEITGLECRLSAETDGVTTAHLTDDSGSVLEQQAIGGLESGQTFTFDTALEADETYWVLCDADGQSYRRGRAAVDYPIESDVLVATHGIYTGSGARSNDYRYCIDRIQPADATLEIGTTLVLGTDDQGQSWAGLTGQSGVRIETTEDVDGLECRLSAQTERVATAYLTTDAGVVIERQTIAALEAGETFAFESELEADTAYRVLCDARGRDYVRGRAAVDYPLESDSLVATHGVYSDDSQSSSYRYCFDRMRPANNVESRVGTLDLESDELAQSWSGLTGRSGIRIRATEDITDIECRLSAMTDGVTMAYLTDDSGTVLDQQAIDSVEAGETFEFDIALEGGEVYRVLCDADEQSYTRGRAAVDYPLEGDSLEATHGIYGGDLQSSNYRYCIDRIRTASTNRGLLASLRNRSLDVTTVDVAEHPSIDENGDLSAELLDYLESQEEVNHEIVLPRGSYKWNTNFVLTDPIEFLAIRGDPRATLEIRNHDVSLAFQFGRWGSNTPPQHVVIQNLDVDISDELERDAGLMIVHAGRCLIDNVNLVGQRTLHGPYSGNRYTFLINTRDENATSVIRNVTATDGEIENPNVPMLGNHTIGFSADPPHEGINVWQQCHVEDFVVSAYYLKNSPGENILDRSTAINNGSSGIRLGVADEARDCKIIFDDMSNRKYAGCGLWFNGGQPVAERIEIDGTDAQNDLVRVNSEADGGHIRNLSVFCGPTAAATTVRCTRASFTDLQGLLIEDFVIDDITTASIGPSVVVRRPDVTLRSGVISVENRPALGGTEEPVLEDVNFQ